MESAKRPERQRYRILGLPDFGESWNRWSLQAWRGREEGVTKHMVRQMNAEAAALAMELALVQRGCGGRSIGARDQGLESFFAGLAGGGGYG